MQGSHSGSFGAENYPKEIINKTEFDLGFIYVLSSSCIMFICFIKINHLILCLLGLWPSFTPVLLCFIVLDLLFKTSKCPCTYIRFESNLNQIFRIICSYFVNHCNALIIYVHKWGEWKTSNLFIHFRNIEP